MTRAYNRRTPSGDVDLPQGAPKPLAEISTGAGIEIEPTRTGMDSADLEAFMHEEVLIIVSPAKENGSLEVITPNVNGINQPIVRGQQIPVKRKYIEALARAHTIGYEQRVQNPSMPENIQMLAKAVPDYPFEVIEDTPKGKAWLKGVRERLQQEVSRA